LSKPSALLLLLFACVGAPRAGLAQEALSFGGGKCGRLEGGVAVPCSGANYEAFATTACLLGRTYLHPLVVEVVLDAYERLADRYPSRTWQYGDLGFEDGGEFWPHKTHRSGVSVDFFFPVVNQDGEADLVPISFFNDLGYGIDFSDQGRFEDLRVDWQALADHLEALRAAAAERGVAIERIILAPALQRRLVREAPRAAALRKHFNRRRAWVVHDEHYHVDFRLPRRSRRPLSCPTD
jgi:penicillin-insensitive murein endopeptidase